MPYIGRSNDFGVRTRYYYTQATAGATSISGLDDDGRRLKFTDGAYVDVYLNGVLLVSGTDYDTDTANTIDNLTALAINDVVEIITYDVFTVADTISATDGGVYNGTVTFNAPALGEVNPENDGSFDLTSGNYFTCTPTGTIDLTFTGEATGQSGMILLVNTTPQTITVDADVFLSAADLTTINAAGTYLMSYYCPDGTNVYLSATPALVEGS